MNSISAATENQTGNVTTKSALAVDNTAPKVTAVDPANKTTNVPSNKVIKVTFSETIKTGTNWIELKNSNGTLIPITKSITGNVLTITPAKSLTEDKYSIILHTGSIIDLTGNPIALWTSKFIAGAAPTITTVDPANKATNVPVNKVIKVTFSEAIKAGNNWIELKSSDGTLIPITKAISGNILTITLTKSLTEDTKYSLILHTGSITDLAGNPLALYTSSFTSDSTGFTLKEIESAAYSIKVFTEGNHELPHSVTVGTSQLTIPQFLQLLTTSLLEINNGKNASIAPGNISEPASYTGSYINGNINKTEYLNIAQTILTYINSNKKAPSYESSSLGNVQYETLVYTYSKILNYYSTNGQLPNYVSVDSSIANPDSYTIQYTSSGTFSNPTLNSIMKSDAGFGYSHAYHTGAELEKYHCGDCWAFSDDLNSKFTAAGYQSRIIQYATAYSSRHRSVQLYENGQWKTVPYRAYGYNYLIV